MCVLSRVRFFATPWTVARQTPLSMGFPRQEYWSGLPFPSPGDLPDPGIEPLSPASPALAGGFFTITPPGKPTHLDDTSSVRGSQLPVNTLNAGVMARKEAFSLLSIKEAKWRL